jgi:hypothetical protein
MTIQGHPPTVPPIPPSKRRRRLNPILAIVGAVVLIAAAVGATLALTGHKLGGSSSTIQPASHSLSGASANYSSFETAYASLKGAIVRITSVGCDGNDYVGSGFVIDAHHIVTAGHVVEGSQSITVIVGANPEPSQIIGLDTSGDLALLHSDGAIPGPYIPLASDDPPVGDRVAAIGFPLGAGLTMTQGSVSALEQNIVVNNTKLAGLVQTDTALNPGNSGGPLLGLDGRANGIVDALNTQANATGYAISPRYALAEVDHWLVSPESHPLPLCASPNPLGSGPAGPPPSTSSGDPFVHPPTGQWISVMASIPQGQGVSVAEQQLSDIAKSVPDAQLLNSDDYSSLRPGYYVVFEGAYSSSDAALAECTAVGRSVPNSCYSRYLS